MAALDSTNDPLREPIVSFADTAARMRRFAGVLLVLLIIVVLLRAFANGAVTGQLVAETVGFGVLLALLGEVVIVGFATVRGARRAARQGERLSRQDVTLTPPQFGRWLDRRFNAQGRLDQF